MIYSTRFEKSSVDDGYGRKREEDTLHSNNRVRSIAHHARQ